MLELKSNSNASNIAFALVGAEVNINSMVYQDAG